MLENELYILIEEFHACELNGFVRKDLKLVRANVICHILDCVEDLKRVHVDQLAELEAVDVPWQEKWTFLLWSDFVGFFARCLLLR